MRQQKRQRCRAASCRVCLFDDTSLMLSVAVHVRSLCTLIDKQITCYRSDKKRCIYYNRGVAVRWERCLVLLDIEDIMFSVEKWFDIIDLFPAPVIKFTVHFRVLLLHDWHRKPLHYPMLILGSKFHKWPIMHPDDLFLFGLKYFLVVYSYLYPCYLQLIVYVFC